MFGTTETLVGAGCGNAVALGTLPIEMDAGPGTGLRLLFKLAMCCPYITEPTSMLMYT